MEYTCPLEVLLISINRFVKSSVAVDGRAMLTVLDDAVFVGLVHSV